MDKSEVTDLRPMREPATIDTLARCGPASVVTWKASEFTSSRVWKAVCRVFSAEAAREQSESGKIVVDEVIARATEWPTLASDAISPNAWLARQDPTINGKNFLVYARGVQEYDALLFRAVVEILNSNAATNGISSGHVEVEVFYGTYPKTPGGIHRETCSNIHMVVDGLKEMHFWDSAEWQPPRDAIRKEVEPESGMEEQYLPGFEREDMGGTCHTVSASRGGGFAWENGTWHVGEAHRQCLALNIACYEESLNRDATRLHLWSNQLCGMVSELWLESYRKHTSYSGDNNSLLAKLSALGMTHGQHFKRGDVQSSLIPLRHVVRVSSAPVIWMLSSSGSLTVSALGSSIEYPDSPCVRIWLEQTFSTPSTLTEVAKKAFGLANWLCRQQVLERME